MGLGALRVNPSTQPGTTAGTALTPLQTCMCPVEAGIGGIILGEQEEEQAHARPWGRQEATGAETPRSCAAPVLRQIPLCWDALQTRALFIGPKLTREGQGNSKLSAVGLNYKVLVPRPSQIKASRGLSYALPCPLHPLEA